MEDVPSKTYSTEKKEEFEYKLVKVENTSEDKTLTPAFDDKKGEKKTGNFVSGKKQDVTYTYQKVVKTKGSFQEHHVYKTLDYDGKVISTKTVLEDGTESSGKKDAEYTTSKKDKDSYVFKDVTPTNKDSKDLGVKFKDDGNEVKGYYVPGKKLEVTYTYEKQPGRFVEIHIYQDEDGKTIEKETIKKDATEGFQGQSYTTKKNDKEGFELVKVESEEGASSNQDGAQASGKYKPGKTQKVTYIYKKKIVPI